MAIAETEVIDFLSIEKEKLNRSLEQLGLKTVGKTNKLRNFIVEDNREASNGLINVLREDIQYQREQFTRKHNHDDLKCAVDFLFSNNDEDSEMNCLSSCYKELKKVYGSWDILTSLNFQETCWACNGGDKYHNTKLMSNFITYEKKLYGNVTKLSFTITYLNLTFNIVLVAKCPQCVNIKGKNKEDDISIFTTPEVDQNIILDIKSILTNPTEFIETIICPWIKLHHCINS